MVTEKTSGKRPPRTRWAAGGPAPRPAQRMHARGCLKGRRVLEGEAHVGGRMDIANAGQEEGAAH